MLKMTGSMRAYFFLILLSLLDLSYGIMKRSYRFASRESDSILTGHVVEEKLSISLLKCALICTDNSECLSMNYHKLERKCEINSATSDQYPQELVKKENVVYLTRIGGQTSTTTQPTTTVAATTKPSTTTVILTTLATTTAATTLPTTTTAATTTQAPTTVTTKQPTTTTLPTTTTAATTTQATTTVTTTQPTTTTLPTTTTAATTTQATTTVTTTQPTTTTLPSTTTAATTTQATTTVTTTQPTTTTLPTTTTAATTTQAPTTVTTTTQPTTTASTTQPTTTAVEYPTDVVMQSRSSGSLDFSRSWKEYVAGFSDETESWIGLEYVHQMTSSIKCGLLIELVHPSGSYYATFTTFQVGGDETNYQIEIGGYAGTAGDPTITLNGLPFSTEDNDLSSTNNLMATMKGGWWVNDQGYTNLNGVYQSSLESPGIGQGIYWIFSPAGTKISYEKSRMTIKQLSSYPTNTDLAPAREPAGDSDALAVDSDAFASLTGR
ncbi:mucin-22-like [Lytechinus variegatus]|uniref:mucin-22-like n=1 Tax=Lytechinus variegatus TaxID=7654 RepID=UPI001BB22501|nr:mucin-22-like [Lytechinus variegatus]